MFRNIHKSLAAIVTSLALAIVPVVVPVTASAATSSDIGNCLKSGSNLSTDCSNADVTTGSSRIQDLIKDAINIFSVIVGIVAVIMIIYGGFRYITSGGDSGAVSGAKNTIIYAIVGLIIVALAQFIVQFVLSKVVS